MGMWNLGTPKSVFLGHGHPSKWLQNKPSLTHIKMRTLTRTTAWGLVMLNNTTTAGFVFYSQPSPNLQKSGIPVCTELHKWYSLPSRKSSVSFPIPR